MRRVLVIYCFTLTGSKFLSLCLFFDIPVNDLETINVQDAHLGECIEWAFTFIRFTHVPIHMHSLPRCTAVALTLDNASCDQTIFNPFSFLPVGLVTKRAL